MLGGAGPQGKKGKLKDAAQDSGILGAVLDFAEASQGFPKPRATGATEQNTRHLGHHRA